MTENKTEGDGKTVSCLSGQIEVCVPEELAPPSEEAAARKFPYDLPPQEIYMDDAGKRILTFNLLEKSLDKNQVYSAVREMQRMIGHIYPESIHDHARGIHVRGRIVGWFSFVTGGVEEDSIHIMFVTPLQNKMMLGSYHFPSQNEAEESENFRKLIRSISVKEETQEESEHRYAGRRIW